MAGMSVRELALAFLAGLPLFCCGCLVGLARRGPCVNRGAPFGLACPSWCAPRCQGWCQMVSGIFSECLGSISFGLHGSTLTRCNPSYDCETTVWMQWWTMAERCMDVQWTTHVAIGCWTSFKVRTLNVLNHCYYTNEVMHIWGWRYSGL